MALCGGLSFFIKMGNRGVRRRPGFLKKIIPLIMPIAHAEGI